MELETVFKTHDRTQALLMGSRLEAAGIEVEMDPDLDPLAGDLAAATASGIQLKVRSSDVTMAREILASVSGEGA